jgi:uncharacterized protein
MSREFPDWVDPWKAADGRRTFQGTMPLKWMKRLSPLLAPYDRGADPGADPEAAWLDARFSATFGYDRQGTVTVNIDVEAALPLVCQRSLETYLERVSRHSVLAVVESIEEEDLVPEHYEPVLAEHRRLALLDLVEDELLLAVPQVPRNPQLRAVRHSTDAGALAVDEGGDEGSGDRREVAELTHRPFEDLATLLAKGRK